jgi:hypothetical protein
MRTHAQVAAARADCAERDEAIAGLTSRCHQAEEATQAAQQQVRHFPLSNFEIQSACSLH